MKLHQTLPLHGTVVPVNASACGIHVIEHQQSVVRPSVEFRTCSVDGTKDAVPVIRGSSLQGESVVARQHKGSTSWFVWLRTFNNEIDLAGPEGLDAMKVDNIRPQKVDSPYTTRSTWLAQKALSSMKVVTPRLDWIPLSPTLGHGVGVLASGRLPYPGTGAA